MINGRILIIAALVIIGNAASAQLETSVEVMKAPGTEPSRAQPK